MLDCVCVRACVHGCMCRKTRFAPPLTHIDTLDFQLCGSDSGSGNLDGCWCVQRTLRGFGVCSCVCVRAV